MSRNRITFVITDLDVGGAERQLVELVTRLPRDEFEPYVLVLFPPPASDEFVARLEQSETPVEFLNLTSKWLVPGVLRRLTHRLVELRPRVVQSFLHHANLLGSLAAKRAGIRRVVTGIRVAERRWNLHCLLARLTDHHVARHVCVSRSVADYAATAMGLTTSKLVVIPNGVDVDRFANAEPIDLIEVGVPRHRRVLLFIGRLDQQKRLDWLLQGMQELAIRAPAHDLVLVGQGPERRRLERLSHEFGVADRVHFAGWRADVPNVLAAADLLVLTSAWEGMTNVVLEAMAAGKPVVATEAEGIAEVLGRLATSPARQLVPADDSGAFVDSVATLAENEVLAAQVGRANRERVRQEFSLERMAERYCDLYRELLAERADSP